MKILLVIAGILLIANFAEGVFGQRNGSYKGSSQSQSQKSSYLGGSNGNYAGSAKVPENAAHGGKPEARSSRGLGISAWGIIGIIIGVVFLTTTGYYAFVLYPYVCKRQTSYDMIELTDVV